VEVLDWIRLWGMEEWRRRGLLTSTTTSNIALLLRRIERIPRALRPRRTYLLGLTGPTNLVQRLELILHFLFLGHFHGSRSWPHDVSSGWGPTDWRRLRLLRPMLIKLHAFAELFFRGLVSLWGIMGEGLEAEGLEQWVVVLGFGDGS
jgi:hypothetical protein